jgi:hypothetical protein
MHVFGLRAVAARYNGTEEYCAGILPLQYALYCAARCFLQRPEIQLWRWKTAVANSSALARQAVCLLPACCLTTVLYVAVLCQLPCTYMRLFMSPVMSVRGGELVTVRFLAPLLPGNMRVAVWMQQKACKVLVLKACQLARKFKQGAACVQHEPPRGVPSRSPPECSHSQGATLW